MEALEQVDELWSAGEEDPSAALIPRASSSSAGSRRTCTSRHSESGSSASPPAKGHRLGTRLACGACALGAAGVLALTAPGGGSSSASSNQSAPAAPLSGNAAGTLIGFAQQRPGCHTAIEGEYCYSAVLGGMQQGLFEKPEDYPGLDIHSDFRDFQKVLHRRNIGGCPEPCVDLQTERRNLVDQCFFDYNRGEEAKCFCQLARNPGCQSDACSCPEGCDGVWNSSRTVTFENRKKAWGCKAPDALLTIPKSYFKNVEFLQTWCPTEMKQLLATMLREGLRNYHQHVEQGARVMQCIHAASFVSAEWLHLHTFCADGGLDGMPAAHTVAWCAPMSNVDEAEQLADQVAEWAAALYGPPPPRRPSNCKELGCGKLGPPGHCSCNPECRNFGDCCSDVDKTCAPHLGM